MKKCVFCGDTYSDNITECVRCKKLLIPSVKADEIIQKSQVKKPKKVPKAWAWIELLSPFVAFIIIIASVFDDNGMGVIIGLLCMIPFFMFIRWGLKDEKANKEERLKKEELMLPYFKEYEQKRVSESFYLFCLNQGINDLSSAANKERAKLIYNNLSAKDKMVLSGSVDSIFKIGASVHKQTLDKEKLQKINSQKTEEQLFEAELTKYANYFGREKRVKMMTDEYERCQKAVDAANKLPSMMINSAYQEKEHDWALGGGIASGLAGGAAGVATAADMQIKNAEIRARNEANRQAVTKMAAGIYSQMAGSITSMSNRAEEMKNGAEAAKTKLVADTPSNEVMKILKFGKVKKEITETGAVKIATECSLKEQIKIFDDVSAVADGSVIAIIKQNGKEIGKAILVLPMNGIGYSSIEGIALCEADRKKPVTVEFKENKLWLMEK